MKQLEVNPSNEKYYTKEFISGYRCGTKRQFESDLTILDKIRAEIRKKMKFNCFNETYVLYDDITEVFDKYKAEGSDKK